MPPMLSKLARAHSSHFVIGVPNGTPLSQANAALKDGHHETLKALLCGAKALPGDQFAAFAATLTDVHSITTGAVTDNLQATAALKCDFEVERTSAKQLMDTKIAAVLEELYKHNETVKLLLDEERADEDLQFDPHATRIEREHQLVHVSDMNIMDRLRAMSHIGKKNKGDRALWVSSFGSALCHTCWRKGGHIFYVYLIGPDCLEYADFVAHQNTGDMRLCAILKTDTIEDKSIDVFKSIVPPDGGAARLVRRRCVRKYRLDINERTFTLCKAGQ
jgi:hypothetical protein